MTFNRNATAEWKGDLKNGSGTVKTESGALDTAYNFVSRFEQGDETNPEELIGAAHAACFSMALSSDLSKADFEPEYVRTEATVTLDMSDGPTITTVTLRTKGKVPGIDAATFQKYANNAKENCPVSRALGALEIELEAELVE